MVWYKVIIVSALSLSPRDKDRLRDRESLTICCNFVIYFTKQFVSNTLPRSTNLKKNSFTFHVKNTIIPPNFFYLHLCFPPLLCKTAIITLKTIIFKITLQQEGVSPQLRLRNLQLSWWSSVWVLHDLWHLLQSCCMLHKLKYFEICVHFQRKSQFRFRRFYIYIH